MKTAAIILAAGASTRLGQRKQLAMLRGETLLERTIRVAHQAGCVPVLVVLGDDADTIRASCKLHPAHAILNPDWMEGMASSIRAGIHAVQAGHADAAIVLTCDQPAVTPLHLSRLKHRGEATGEPIASAYAGRSGVPAWFPRTRFPELLMLAGDAGARALLSSAESVNLEHGELDVDTPKSLQAARILFG